MRVEKIHSLDSETLELFASKGMQCGPDIRQVGNSVGVKVRRIMQITSDLVSGPFDQLRILDLACGEGVYAIEAALRGAEVVAVDGRIERMSEGDRAASRLGLSNLRFEQDDIRNINSETHGHFDVIFFLGILYHLDGQDILPILENLYGMCEQALIIDTHIALVEHDQVEYNGSVFKGTKVREHDDTDSEEVRKGKLLMSLDNTWSFWFTMNSLTRLLNDIGFTSVYICNVPLEPYKPENRITLVARKGTPVKISTYPWINDKSESEIQAVVETIEQTPQPKDPPSRKQRIKSMLNRVLHPLGFEINRIDRK